MRVMRRAMIYDEARPKCLQTDADWIRQIDAANCRARVQSNQSALVAAIGDGSGDTAKWVIGI